MTPTPPPDPRPSPTPVATDEAAAAHALGVHRLAHHFDDLAQQHRAAELGMWAFLATEVLFFGGAIAAYSVYRMTYFDAFAAASNQENWLIGAFNTAALLTSSLTMALAVRAAQLGNSPRVSLFLAATIALALTFIGVKFYEYAHLIDHGLAPWGDFRFDPPELAGGARIFFSFYFALTGIHATHMVVGVGLMLWLLSISLRRGFDDAFASPVEMTGLYWHFVDIVWIFLYPLLYLVHRS